MLQVGNCHLWPSMLAFDPQYLPWTFNFLHTACMHVHIVHYCRTRLCINPKANFKGPLFISKLVLALNISFFVKIIFQIFSLFELPSGIFSVQYLLNFFCVINFTILTWIFLFFFFWVKFHFCRVDGTDSSLSPHPNLTSSFSKVAVAHFS